MLNMRLCFGLVSACLFAGSLSATQVRELPLQDSATADSLSRAEVARLLDASRASIAGKRGRLTSQRDNSDSRTDLEFVVDTNGRLLLLRSSSVVTGGTVDGAGTRVWNGRQVIITQLTGRPARACDGRATPGELTIVYRNVGDGWSAAAHAENGRNVATLLFKVLSGDLAVEGGELRQVGDRLVRALTTTWIPPVDQLEQPDYRSDDGGRTWTKPTLPYAPQLRLVLWLNTVSLRPISWEVTSVPDPEHNVVATEYARMSVEYDDTINLEAPASVTPPDCVP